MDDEVRTLVIRVTVYISVVSLGRLSTDACYVKKSTACTDNGDASCLRSADLAAVLRRNKRRRRDRRTNNVY